MTEDPEDRGYRPTRLWGHWQLQGFSISNADGRRPVCSPGVKGQGRAMQQHSNKQKARVSPMGATQQPRYKAARMRRSKNGRPVVRVRPPPWRRPPPLTPCNPLPAAHAIARRSIARFSVRLQPSLALGFHRPLVPILYAADPSQASLSIVQKHTVATPVSPLPSAAPIPQIYTVPALHVRGQYPIGFEVLVLSHV